MQYKSLFCIKGRDNWLRFSVISGSLYLILLLGFVISGVGGSVVFLALLLAPILGLSTLRRLHDIELRYRFIGLTLFPFVLLSLSLAYSGSVIASLTCVVIGFLLTFFLVIQKSIPSREIYHQGYSGPAFSSEKIQCRSRVEPTLDNSMSVVEEVNSDNKERIPFKEQETESIEAWEQGVSFELWLIWTKKNQTLLFGVIGGLLFLMVLSSFWSIFATSEDEHYIEPQSIQSISQIVSVREEVKLADGFRLLLEGEVLIMSWLGESGEPGVIWSLATGEGDKSCSNLVFDNGSKYRPILVELMSDTSIETRFTPLDTQEIIANIARRVSVKVCGYDFSLKGSQLALAKNEVFRRYL